MTTTKYVLYRRVSTSEQSRSGLGLLAQERDIKLFLENYSPAPWEIVGEFTDTASGTDSHRPVLRDAIELAKREKATLLVSKLDRLSRKVSFLAALMDDKRLNFKVATMPQADKFQLHIYAALAEQERDFISQRTKAALREAKGRGVRLGNPTNLSEAQAISRKRRTSQAEQFAANVRPIIDDIKAAGVSNLRGIADALNARGIKTARNGQWQAGQVKRVLDRAA